jgi:hypothetical protein
MTLPKITTKQQTLLRLLYTYRFLDRAQVQTLMHHQNKGRSSKWLKDLKEKQYIEWIYNGIGFSEKTKPAIYYLGLNGIRYLRELNEYPAAQLRKRYTEGSRKQALIEIVHL